MLAIDGITPAAFMGKCYGKNPSNVWQPDVGLTFITGRIVPTVQWPLPPFPALTVSIVQSPPKPPPPPPMMTANINHWALLLQVPQTGCDHTENILSDSNCIYSEFLKSAVLKSLGERLVGKRLSTECYPTTLIIHALATDVPRTFTILLHIFENCYFIRTLIALHTILISWIF